jgi:glucosamine--fructose-6-phosphate aminotransferase (isomerizing)
MCGIVGYLGPQNPKDVIISGLRKLEYRGYDSAGIAVLDQGKTKRVRAQGKLKALEDKIVGEKFDGHIGIGHTRWATHGAPSERNAHPHRVDGISLVHNGIIENYMEIREALIAEGAVITSDTDSELVAHLIAREVKVRKDLYLAVEKTLSKIRGAFSIVVMWEETPNQLVAFKDGPPLVVGLADTETFVASDVQALIQYTRKFLYLDDREIVLINETGVKVFSDMGKPIYKKTVELNWDPQTVEKQGYAHYMLKEIYEQPRAVAAAMEPHVNPENFTIRLKNMGFGIENLQKLEEIDSAKDWSATQAVFKNTERVFIIACGTSSYAGMVGKYLIENIAKLPVEVDIASEFRYRNPVVPAKTLVITISQSGETADTLAAIRLAKEMGANTLSICNVRNSTIDREAHGHMYMNSGPEIGVASTKAFTSTLTVLNCLALAMGTSRGVVSLEKEREHVQALLAAPSQLEVVLAFDKYFDEASHKLQEYRGFLYLGRGVSFPIAMEGALKLKELAYLHAEGYAAGEMKHGPLALIDKDMAIVMLAPSDELYEKSISNLEEARARGGQVIAIGSGENEKLRGISQYYLSLPKAHWTINPILEAVPMQLMAYHLACTLGHDVDQPRNLAKSVTVE